MKSSIDVSRAGKAQAPVPFVVLLDDDGFNGLRTSWRMALKADSSVKPRPFPGTHHGPPIIRCIFLQEQYFKLASAGAVDSAQPGRDDFGVVHDEQISWPQVVQQVREPAM